jgi:hypothetical protein
VDPKRSARGTTSERESGWGAVEEQRGGDDFRVKSITGTGAAVSLVTLFVVCKHR